MIVPLVLTWLGWVTLETADPSAQARDILAQRCVSCHGPTQQKGGVRLDLNDFLSQTGARGPVVVPGKSSQSELMRRIQAREPGQRMPPKGDPLTPEQISLLATWIDSGAPVTAFASREKDPRLSHWAWQPLQQPTIPNDQTGNRPEIAPSSHPIDRFVRDRLAKKGWTPSPRADRRTLIRRLSIDLLGLPPRPEEIEAFVKDPDPRAFERLVDRYLSSPHYGERWARHWLDIAHYADTHGFERDQRRDNAWRYRDWVIQAFNRDLPYDQFLADQIAGDALRPQDPEAIVATGFLAAGPWDFVGQSETPSPVIKRQARADDLDDMVTQVLTATCALTIHCARCHDHKVDPISQREYFGLVAVFAGLTRGDRDINPAKTRMIEQQKEQIQHQLARLRIEAGRLKGQGLDLADIVGGGDGRGGGTRGMGIHPVTAKPAKEKLGIFPGDKANRFSPWPGRFIDGVTLVQGGPGKKVTITSSGLTFDDLPTTTGQGWDLIRNGPVNEQKSTRIGAVDFQSPGHSVLGIHANAAITFRIADFQKELGTDALRFRASLGYGGRPEADSFADARIVIDGKTAFLIEDLNPRSGLVQVDLPLPTTAKWLTIIATEGKDGTIGHDQVFLGDPTVGPVQPSVLPAVATQRLKTIETEIQDLETQKGRLGGVEKVYTVNPGQVPEVRVQKRGNPEQTGEVVSPGTVALIAGLDASLFGSVTDDASRRKALVAWINHPQNPLPARVIVNRLWHHHFGQGLVDTPSDFGLSGSKPSHPELLDWLACQLRQSKGSLKAIHRLICTSETYQQTSRNDQEAAMKADAGNRYLWRQNPRRLDAESIRDAILATSGCLNTTPFGPGYRDFDYKEEYAPVYGYITADQPDLWRRSIYRFVVRTTPQPLLTTLDCPNPASLAPARHVTTTALQSLALLNNEFLLRQSDHFAARLTREVPSEEARVDRAFRLALGRSPSPQESQAGLQLARTRGLNQLCRMLFNSNEFVYVD